MRRLERGLLRPRAHADQFRGGHARDRRLGRAGRILHLASAKVTGDPPADGRLHGPAQAGRSAQGDGELGLLPGSHVLRGYGRGGQRGPQGNGAGHGRPLSPGFHRPCCSLGLDLRALFPPRSERQPEGKQGWKNVQEAGQARLAEPEEYLRL